MTDHKCTRASTSIQKEKGRQVCDGRIVIEAKREGTELRRDHVCSRCKHVYSAKELAVIFMLAARQALMSVEFKQAEVISRVNELIDDVKYDRISPSKGEDEVTALSEFLWDSPQAVRAETIH